MYTDEAACLRAIRARDARFDGVFYTGVTSTGIYCRPSCPARTPNPGNVRFYPTAAAAQEAGFRACKRCLPGAAPGSPEWDIRGDTVGRAMRLIDDGVVDRDGVPGLASELGYSIRQVQRLLATEVGAGPVALARTRRAQTARTLLEATSLPMTDVAFASGFTSLRSFNVTIREVYAATPSQLRDRAGRPAQSVDGALTFVDLTLPARTPFCPCNVFGHLIATAIAGVETFHDGAYHRTMRLPEGWGVVSLHPPASHTTGVAARIGLTHISQLPTAISRVRRLLDLDADPAAITDLLGGGPALGHHVCTHPGRRIPRSVDAEELALRVVLGQQVSTAAAQTHGARLVAAIGTPVETTIPGLSHLFPTPETVAEVSDATLAFPDSRRQPLRRLAAVLAEGDLNLGVGTDRAQARHDLLQLKGIGAWSVEMIAMRGLGDPDAFPATDLGVLRGLATLDAADPEQWRPWRSYATQYLWAMTPHAVNTIPGHAGCHPEEQ